MASTELRAAAQQAQPEALRLADALEMSSNHGIRRDAAAELRRLHAENEALKRSVALLQQHHATAWNRGHMMGMAANRDTARRALDAVKQDAWGNTQLTEALLKAEDQRDALLEALRLAATTLRGAGVDELDGSLIQADLAIAIAEENT